MLLVIDMVGLVGAGMEVVDGMIARQSQGGRDGGGGWHVSETKPRGQVACRVMPEHPVCEVIH